MFWVGLGDWFDIRWDFLCFWCSGWEFGWLGVWSFVGLMLWLCFLFVRFWSLRILAFSGFCLGEFGVWISSLLFGCYKMVLPVFGVCRV